MLTVAVPVHRVKDDDKDIYHLIPYSVDQEMKLMKLSKHSAHK